MAACLLLTIALIPATTQAGQTSYVGPCVEVSISPPGAGAGECATGTFNDLLTRKTFSVVATANGSDVDVTWNHTSIEGDIVAYRVFRGLTPAQLHQTATTPATASEYIDEGAVTSGEAFWYAVAAELADGSTVKSDPVPVTGASATTEQG